MSSLSFEFAWVPSGAPSGSRVHSGSYGFTRASLGDVGFILVRLGSLGRNKGSSGSFGLVWRPLCAPKGCRVHWGSRGYTRALSGFFFRFAWFTRARLGVVMLIGFTPARLVVVGFILVCVGSHRCS